MKILLVDDSLSMRKIQKHALKKAGYEDILEAVDGLNALEKLQEIGFKVDLIILDIDMPVMDGLTALKKLKGSQRSKHIPVIMCTAHSNQENVVEGLSGGAAAYIVKPFKQVELTSKIAEIVPGVR